MDFDPGGIVLHDQGGMKSFDVEVFDGARYLSLNDKLNYIIGAKTFGQRQQARRRITVQSSVYEGTWEVHSVRENVTEMIEVYVLGSDQNLVTENLLRLEDAFSQPLYNIRVTMDNHVETWRCQPAEWSLERTHVLAHNLRAHVTFSVPRLPKVTHEVQG